MRDVDGLWMMRGHGEVESEKAWRVSTFPVILIPSFRSCHYTTCHGYLFQSDSLLGCCSIPQFNAAHHHTVRHGLTLGLC